MIHAPLTAALPTLQAASMVDLDASALISGGIFIVMMLLLNQLLFKPYLAITHERARLTTGAKDTADATFAQADELMIEYEKQLGAARSEASALRDDLRRNGESDEQRIVSSAREQASAQLAQKREALQKQIVDAEKQIDARAAELSQAIVGRVLS